MTSILREHSAHGPLWLQEKIFSCLRLLLGLAMAISSSLYEQFLELIFPHQGCFRVSRSPPSVPSKPMPKRLSLLV